ncbi:ABC transporter ATP-binding protein [Endomicrobium proavitum]|uniref:Lipid A export ATP-binding/permease protein MsbA n=1 Tax=Endomicrobium proavitum TaxID=1408281 RepID=A0A0G3WHM8_9BACT|nr:ABC transporter ATP-binding protein [Endomicrobium proavitum]AKL97838.1 Lipid A export ATP-binding/permease protein MsbA [Endomicrobium proavitum]
MAEKKKINFKKLYSYLKPYLLRLIIAVVFMSAFAGVTMSLLAVLVKAIDGIFVNKNSTMLVFAAIAVPAIFALKGLFDYGRSYLLSYVGQNVIRNLRMDMYKKFIYLSHDFYVQNSSPKMMSRITNDLGALQNAIVTIPVALIRDSLTFIGLLAAAFYLNWKFSLIAFVGFPLAAFPLVSFARKMRRQSKAGQQQIAEIYASLHQMLNGFSVIKAFNSERHEDDKFQSDNLKYYGIALGSARVSARSSPTMNFIGAVAVSVILFLGGKDVISGVWTAGAFIAFVAAVGQMYEPVKRFSSVNSQIQSAITAYERVFEIMDAQPSIQDAPNAVALPIFSSFIEYKNVDFGYLPDKNVIENFNVKINFGETVAFVGHSGSGKTTIANLLLRFYDPNSGEVFIDGNNIKKVTLESLRSQVGIVSQDVLLFDDTVKYNISYGSFDASMEDIIRAAKNANIHDLITKLPQGYDTPVGERGMKLSGGEKQRISIARAMLKNPPILVLDEATSALDSESEKLVQTAVENLMKNRTVILIAHRLSTIKNADKIIVMDLGKIAEFGTHEELIKIENGAYKKLTQTQVL